MTTFVTPHGTYLESLSPNDRKCLIRLAEPYGTYVEFPLANGKKCRVRVADVSLVEETWDDVSECVVWTGGSRVRLKCTYDECCAALGMTAAPTA